MRKVRIINGPNLNLLGLREPGVYGTATLEDIKNSLLEQAREYRMELDFFQSNHEGEIIDSIHEAYLSGFKGIIINPGAYTHYSYAIRDGISAVKLPVVEVHLSNIHAREEFRSRSVVAPACIGQISGLGPDSYLAALYVLHRRISD